jgi:8-oxo-dGTP pyrophosphatase MutT (NUDIX family)
VHRENLRKLLGNYSVQNDLKQRFVEFISMNSDCFERRCIPGHITASAWLLNHDATAVLLTHHRKLNRWFQPGGHCDGDSNVLAAALREAIEETGIFEWTLLQEGIFDLDIHSIPARKSDPEHFHYDIRFVFQCNGSEEYTVSEESHDLAWVKLNELEKYTDEESVLRMARKTTMLRQDTDPSTFDA